MHPEGFSPKQVGVIGANFPAVLLFEIYNLVLHIRDLQSWSNKKDHNKKTDPEGVE